LYTVQRFAPALISTEQSMNVLSAQTAEAGTFAGRWWFPLQPSRQANRLRQTKLTGEILMSTSTPEPEQLTADK